MAATYAQRQVVASLTVISTYPNSPAIDGYFAQVSRGEITASVEKIYIGGQPFPVTLCAPSEVGDITLTKHLTSDYRTLLQTLRPLAGKAYYQIDVYELDCDLVSEQSKRKYAKALLVGLSEPEGDASSGAPVTFALTFAVDGPPA